VNGFTGCANSGQRRNGFYGNCAGTLALILCCATLVFAQSAPKPPAASPHSDPPASAISPAASAATTPSTTDAGASTVTVPTAPTPPSLLSTLADLWAKSKITEQIAGVLILALGAWLTKVKLRLTKVHTKLDRLRSDFSSLRYGLPEQSQNRYLKVCVLGIGGAGKTTLVRTFTQCPDANPAASTGDLRKFITVNEYAGPSSRFGIRIDWYDYAGQNPGQITQRNGALVEMPEIDDLPTSSASYDRRPFDAVFLVLDLFDPPSAGQTYTTTFSEWNKKRLKKSAEAWNTNALALVKGSLGTRCVRVPE
jgi:hypothetical protein